MAVIVISYNTRQMTLDCLASVVAETRSPHEIVVVDNASTDGSAEAIAAAFPGITLIAETENRGFGPAHPIAIAASRAPMLLLLNPDTVVLDGALDRLLAFARRTPEAKIWGGRTLHADGTVNPTSCYRAMSLWSVFCRVAGLNGLFKRSDLFNPEFFGGWQCDAEREVDIVTGCLLMIEREFWEALGGFDPAFTMYGEEVDLCLRARAMGARPRVSPEATIIHYGGASQAVKSDKGVRLMRAKIALIERHFPARSRALGRWLFRLWPLSRRMAYSAGARLLGRPGLGQQAEIWRDVWARRAEWERGFPDAAPGR